ncbi:hypothetical protein DFR24_3255 [Panacagrimonas perspica]|uniref:Styrene-oxide isomerase n=1 Tax=Panacagrimonas perspica TaxID=381431 RepID=A0A4R7P510_9GAMM|nr:hypothetical protein [Panacagrimonas perspica]TDU28875.1 hypothetical protein DFR24_3255 [Panacagrimonas perspica]THD02298.1 hypothetical protein B1810_15330 [Panacagrimonas perspica]
MAPTISDIDARAERLQDVMQGHAALGVFVGLVGGWLFAFAQMQEVNLWPFFAFEVHIPGDARGWAGAHVGPILNGMLCAFGAAVVPKLDGKFRAAIAWTLIATVWLNIVFYFCVPFGNVHCMTGGYSKTFGATGNVFDAVGYWAAVSVAPFTMASTILIAAALLRPRRSA